MPRLLVPPAPPPPSPCRWHLEVKSGLCPTEEGAGAARGTFPCSLAAGTVALVRVPPLSGSVVAKEKPTGITVTEAQTKISSELECPCNPPSSKPCSIFWRRSTYFPPRQALLSYAKDSGKAPSPASLCARLHAPSPGTPARAGIDKLSGRRKKYHFQESELISQQ